jgi:hypothetical protein
LPLSFNSGHAQGWASVIPERSAMRLRSEVSLAGPPTVKHRGSR